MSKRQQQSLFGNGEGWIETGDDRRIDEFVNLKVGEAIEGLLIGRREIGESGVWLIENGGKIYGINSRTVLDRKLSEVPIGSPVRILREPNAKSHSGREYHVFKIWYMPR